MYMRRTKDMPVATQPAEDVHDQRSLGAPTAPPTANPAAGRIPELPTSTPPVTVTVQVTLPGGDGAMTTAARLAEHLHTLTSVATSDTTPTADVSTTVAVLVDRTGPAEAVTGAAPPPLVAELGPTCSTAEPLCIDTGRRDVRVSGVPLRLTRREYDLLVFLVGHPGRVFTRPQLLKWVWGHDIISGERTVDVHVRRLRRKLRQLGPIITTVRGIGYRLDDAARVTVLG
jgi:Transcriptional regulatory protein, C terminal